MLISKDAWDHAVAVAIEQFFETCSTGELRQDSPAFHISVMLSFTKKGRYEAECRTFDHIKRQPVTLTYYLDSGEDIVKNFGTSWDPHHNVDALKSEGATRWTTQ